VIGRVTTQQFSSPSFTGLRTTRVNGNLVSSEGELTFSDFVNIFPVQQRVESGIAHSRLAHDRQLSESG
jgi:hypothetical protein